MDPDLNDGSVASLLAGVRAIDFTQALSGPYCTLMMADLGMDVIKVESPRGDDSRRWGPPFRGSDSTYFLSVNRNKRSVVMDLKTVEGVAAARALIATADVVVENWRPGTADRLGIGPAAVRRDFPRVVYCSISGFGPGGEHRAAYDQIVQGTSGAMTITGPAGRPTKWGIPIADVASGMFAATAILAALRARDQDGRGRHIEIAMEDSIIAMLSHHAARQLATGNRPLSDDNGHATISPYGMFPAADGHVNICVGNDGQFRRMCAAIELDGPEDDLRFATNSARVAHKDELFELLNERLRELPAAAIVARLEEAGVPVGAVRFLDEALSDPAVRQRDMIVELERDDFGVAEVSNGPWRIDGHTARVRRHPPKLGEHTAELLADPTETAILWDGDHRKR